MNAPSRLSSLLVHDGIVGVKRLEQAFQRQVIYGGALDTNLLELGVLGEEQMTDYLAQSSGIPAANRDLLEFFDPRAVQICPREVAEAYRVSPVAFAGEALRVVTIDPVDFSTLEALATHIMTPVQPYVVPEFRFNLLTERLFGVPAPSRFVALAAKLAAAVHRPIPINRAAAPESPARPPSKPTTSPFSTDAVARSVELREQQRRAASPGPHQVAPAPQPQVAPVGPRAATVPEPDASPVSLRTEAITPRLPRGQLQALVEASAVVRTPWRGGQTVDPRPLEPSDAADALARAGDRDAVFSALIRGVRSRAGYAAVLVVQGEMAYGRLAIDGDAADPDIVQAAIPITQIPAFAGAIEAGAPYVGPVATGDEALDAALERLGGQVPPAALILPVTLRNRAIALVYAHRGSELLSFAQVSEVLSLAQSAGLSLSRVILRAKSEGYHKEREPAEEVPPAGAPVKPPAAAATAPAAAAATATDGPRPEAPTVPIDVGPPEEEEEEGTPIDSVLDAIEAGGAGAAEAADQAVRRADETLLRLRRRLPGKLWIDRYAAGARPNRASQHGPLLALLVRLGDRAAPLLGELIGSDSRELRYYTTLACCEVRSTTLLPGLVSRLFDFDHGVRAAALDALLGYRQRELDEALAKVREWLHGETGHARAAAHALGELHDVGAVPALIAATEREPGTAEEARRALVAITKQDFGTKTRKWRAWWEKNHERPRVEWLLDGLAHPEDHVRLAASEELKRLTGEYFGYHYDLPKRQREEARLRWVKWWEESRSKSG